VPTPTVSVIDFTAILGRDASKDDINQAMREYSQDHMVGILGYTEEPLVSMDLKGDTRSSIFSGLDTLVVGNLAKVVSWYDNEYGYACRLSDITAFVARHLSGGASTANGAILKEIVGDPGMWGKNPRLRQDSAASTAQTVSSKE
jgi:glyceraldehyde-3-phosphate dehydrogenase/erythrose-4-phosphate dehydrogenase